MLSSCWSVMDVFPKALEGLMLIILWAVKIRPQFVLVVILWLQLPATYQGEQMLWCAQLWSLHFLGQWTNHWNICLCVCFPHVSQELCLSNKVLAVVNRISDAHTSTSSTSWFQFSYPSALVGSRSWLKYWKTNLVPGFPLPSGSALTAVGTCGVKP